MRIIGICLVRNEDIHLDRAVANAREFCDRVLIADHQSDDRTPEIAEAWAARDPRVEYRRIGHPRESQDWILPFVNTPTWVFGFDGDEIYDPAGLARLRADLLAGRYDAYPRINGHVLHCTSLDIAAGVAAGYMAPPSRTMTKLYNFRAISEWRGPAPERLHGGRVTFNPGYEGVANLDMHEQTDWGHSPFRCLHLVFLRRSSRDPGDGSPRPNIAEKNSYSLPRRLRAVALRLAGREQASEWKREKYRRGPVVTLNASPFLEALS
jgi:glycosyltransferase involved in cell wall biosynthesis